MLTKMVAAAQKSIERDYYCKLVGSDDELQALPEGVRGFVADEDIQLAMQYLVGDAYLNGFTGQWLETAAVRHLLSIAGEYGMSLKPEEMTCRLSIGYMQSGRGRWVNICRNNWSRPGKPGRSASWCRAEGPHTGSTAGC